MKGKKLFGGFQAVKAEKAMAPHSSTLAWKIHGRKSLIGYTPRGRKESDMIERLHFLSFLCFASM